MGVIDDVDKSISRLVAKRILAFFWRLFWQHVLRPRLEPKLALAQRYHHERRKLGSGWRSLNDYVEFDVDFADRFLPSKRESGAGSVITLRKRKGIDVEVSNAVVVVEVFGTREYGEKFHLQDSAPFEEVTSYEEVEKEGCSRRPLKIEPQTFRCEGGYIYCKYDEVRVTLKALTVDGHTMNCDDSVRSHLTFSDHLKHQEGWYKDWFDRHWNTELFQATQAELRSFIKNSLLLTGERYGGVRLGLWGRVRKLLVAVLTLPKVLVRLFWVCLALDLIIPDEEGSIMDDEGNVRSRIRGLSIRSVRARLGLPERD